MYTLNHQIGFSAQNYCTLNRYCILIMSTTNVEIRMKLAEAFTNKFGIVPFTVQLSQQWELVFFYMNTILHECYQYPHIRFLCPAHYIGPILHVNIVYSWITPNCLGSSSCKNHCMKPNKLHCVVQNLLDS